MEKTEKKPLEERIKDAGPGELVTYDPETEQLPAAMPTQHALSPLEQMQMAKQMGMSVEEMKDMLELQKDYEANEARKAFHAALAEFKKNPPRVVKDKLNNQYDSTYTSIGNMVNTVNEAMGPFGLNARWDFPVRSDGVIEVTCILAHTMGHEEKVTLTGEPDTSGTKNPLQGRKSARTYLKLETFEAVTGMASEEGNLNDDGNAAGKPTVERISEDQALKIDSILEDNELNRAIFEKWVKKIFPYTDGDPDQLAAEHYDKVIDKLNESIQHKGS